MDVLLTLMT